MLKTPLLREINEKKALLEVLTNQKDEISEDYYLAQVETHKRFLEEEKDPNERSYQSELSETFKHIVDKTHAQIHSELIDRYHGLDWGIYFLVKQIEALEKQLELAENFSVTTKPACR